MADLTKNWWEVPGLGTGQEMGPPAPVPPPGITPPGAVSTPDPTLAQPSALQQLKARLDAKRAARPPEQTMGRQAMFTEGMRGVSDLGELLRTAIGGRGERPKIGAQDPFFDKLRANIQVPQIQEKEAKQKMIAKGRDKEENLRKEYLTSPVSKETMQISTAMRRLNKAGQIKSAAGDLALIFNFMKIQDPRSVVRESEFKNAQEARAWLTEAEGSGAVIPAFVKQAILKLQTGESLLPEQRDDFLNTANNIYQGQLSQQQQLAATYDYLARGVEGVRPEFVVVPFGQDIKVEKKPKKTTAEAQPLTPEEQEELDKLEAELGGL